MPRPPKQHEIDDITGASAPAKASPVDAASVAPTSGQAGTDELSRLICARSWRVFFRRLVEMTAGHGEYVNIALPHAAVAELADVLEGALAAPIELVAKVEPRRRGVVAGVNAAHVADCGCTRCLADLATPPRDRQAYRAALVRDLAAFRAWQAAGSPWFTDTELVELEEVDPWEGAATVDTPPPEAANELARVQQERDEAIMLAECPGVSSLKELAQELAYRAQRIIVLEADRDRAQERAEQAETALTEERELSTALGNDLQRSIGLGRTAKEQLEAARAALAERERAGFDAGWRMGGAVCDCGACNVTRSEAFAAYLAQPSPAPVREDGGEPR